MTTLNFYSKEKGNLLKKIIDDCYSIINLAIKDLQVILDVLLKFYYNKEHRNIEDIITVINDLKNGKLNCFEKKYTKKYILYRENYEEKANERALKRKIKFFSVILKRNKEKHKFNKDACVEQTMKDFD